MTNLEIEQIRDYMKDKVFSTKDEIMEFMISINPERRPSNLRFYLFDLVRANVIHKYDTNRYKYNGKLKQFVYTLTNSDLELKDKIESRFDDIELCVWNTSFISQYLNLMPYDYYTFVATNKNYLELVFNYLKSSYKVLYKPTMKELDYYVQKNNQVILKNLIIRSPLDKNYTNYIGINKGFQKQQKIVFSPRIEKILVDVFVERDNFSVFSELHEIYRGIFSAYCINFQKLFYYAKNRGVYEDLYRYIISEIQFDFETGELR
jgi:hypothetical protein